MKYNADLGTWERGVNVKIVADSDKEAIQKALTEIERLQKQGRLPKEEEGSQFIVQMRREGKLFYDFMQGNFDPLNSADKGHL